jgi:hypothetical protein
LPKITTPWKESLFFAVKLVGQKLPIFYAEVTPTMCMLPISAHILDSFWNLLLFRKWNKGMDINPADQIFYTTQYQRPF